MKRIRRTAIITALSGALVTGVGVSQAAAAPNQSPARHTITSSATAPMPASQTAPAPLPAAPAAPGNTTSPNADSGVPIAVRLAVKAALAIVKSRSIATYNKIISYVNRGKAAFVSWWNNNAPDWFKRLVDGVSAAAVWEAIRWVLGL